MRDLNPERYLLFSDVKAIFLRVRRQVFWVASILALLTFFYFFRIQPVYEIKATFKEGGLSQADTSGGFTSQFFRGFGLGKHEGTAVGLMKSRNLLQGVAESVGLQASVADKGLRLSIRENMMDNLAILCNRKIPDTDPFLFQDVNYLGSESVQHSLTFSSMDTFTIDDKYEGIIGEPLSFDGVTLTLIQIPDHFKFSKEYSLTITPIREWIDHLCESIDIESSKDDPSILELSYYHRNQQAGKRVLNTLMSQFKTYLIEENQRVADAQCDYLGNRKQEIIAISHKSLQSYVDYLKENIGDEGYFDFDQEGRALSQSKQSIIDALFNIDFELSQLGRKNRDALMRHSPFSQEYSQLRGEFFALKKERNSIDTALLEQGDLLEQGPFFIHTRSFVKEPHFAAAEELCQLRKEKEEIHNALQREVDEEDLGPLFENKLRMISLREKILQEHMIHPNEEREGFQGMDLTTARTVFYEYSKTLNELEVTIKQLNYLHNEMKKGQFEISALCTVLVDPMSQKMVKEASDLTHQIRDNANVTERDRSRYQGMLDRKKEDLSYHLSHCIELKRLHAELLEGKRLDLQQEISHLLSQEMSILESQMNECLDKHAVHLGKEKAFYEAQIEGITEQIGKLPDKWLYEKEFEASSHLNMNMMKGIVQLVESKNIDHQLSQIESRPLDRAYAMLKPKSTLALLFAFLVGGTSAVMTFGCFLARELSRGMPLSLESLRFRNRVVAGCLHNFDSKSSLSAITDDSLEVLRKIVSKLLLRRGIAAGLLQNHSSDYSTQLAELLAKHGMRSLIITMDCHESSLKVDDSDLIDYWDNTVDNPIHKRKHFDTVSLGKGDRYGVEFLKSEPFLTFLDKMKCKYDYLLLCSQALLTSMEAKEYTAFVEVLVLTVDSETIEELDGYFTWDGSAIFLTI